MKTVKMTIESYYPSGWYELANDLLFEKFKKDRPHHNPKELDDDFYNLVVNQIFEYGEFANIEIEVDEDLNIVGGRIIPFKQ